MKVSDIADMNSMKEIADANLAVGLTALTGVCELAAALTPTIGPVAAENIRRKMVSRLSQFTTPAAFNEAVTREINDRFAGRSAI